MSHALHVIPDQKGNAATNMAHDFLLLQRYQPKEAIRIRHYEWSRPAYTFGMSQKISYVSSEIQDQSVELVRRPTGGG
ncbi:MAG: lipoate--protein ligase family protein, partial [Verrucomicrobiota bacterium]